VADEVYQFLYYADRPPAPLAAYTAREHLFRWARSRRSWPPACAWAGSRPARAGQAHCCLRPARFGRRDEPLHLGHRALGAGAGNCRRTIAGLRSMYAGRAAALDARWASTCRGSPITARRAVSSSGRACQVGWNAGEFLPHAARFQVGFRSGVNFSPSGGLRDHMRLCFAYYSEEELALGWSGWQKLWQHTWPAADPALERRVKDEFFHGFSGKLFIYCSCKNYLLYSKIGVVSFTTKPSAV